jgi:hypothetical protein
MTPNRERPERVILEIIRQSGGQIGKAMLFKAFWLAHLFYSKKEPGYLTDWPIVRMPNGPGIHRADTLIDELIAGGHVEKVHEPKGPFTEITCRLTDKTIENDLPPLAVAAVKEAVEFLKGHTTDSISELSHEFSRSWNSLPNGEELNIYSDMIPDDIYQERQKELSELKKAYEELFE